MPRSTIDFHRATEVYGRIFRWLADSNLNLSQLRALHALYKYGERGCSKVALAREMNLEVAYNRVVCRQLVKMGYASPSLFVSRKGRFGIRITNKGMRSVQQSVGVVSDELAQGTYQCRWCMKPTLDRYFCTPKCRADYRQAYPDEFKSQARQAMVHSPEPAKEVAS